MTRDALPSLGSPRSRDYVALLDKQSQVTVHVLVGLPAVGKTTVAHRIAAKHRAVRFTLDEWMLRLYGLAFDDDEYVARLPVCRDLVLDVAAQALAAGVDVVLDWNHWSPDKRASSAAWAAGCGAAFIVHHVTAPLDVARAQLAQRNAAGDSASHAIDPEALDHALSYLVPPAADEGYPICVHAHDRS